MIALIYSQRVASHLQLLAETMSGAKHCHDMAKLQTDGRMLSA
jgi:hypothetical protein